MTVPASAASLLAFIRRTETGRQDNSAYDTIYGHNERHLPKPLTSMTLDEVIALGPSWTKAYKSSAAGAYQFMNATLKDLKAMLGLLGNERMTPAFQDRLGYHLLRRRGYDLFMAGDIDLVEFAKRLAMEWASLPVLNATKGQHRQLKPGQSYYAGDGVNKSLVKPADVAAVLKQAFEAGNTVPPREPKPPVFEPIPAEPLPAPTAPAVRPGVVPLIVLGLAAAAVAAWVWWAGQQPSEPASLLGAPVAPVPLDRPVSLFGGPGSSLAGEIGWAILMSFIPPIAGAAATYLVGWVLWLWSKVLKTDFDKKSAEQLHAALSRGILAGIEYLGARASKGKVLAFAADYAQQWNGGTVKRFGLTHDQLQELAVPHLAAVKRGVK